MRSPSCVLVIGLLAGAPAVAEESRAQPGAEPYLATARERIHRRWVGFVRELQRLPADSPLQSQRLVAEVLFVVEGDGRISSAEMTRSSAVKGFDEAPIDLLRDVAALPPPPAAACSDDGRAYLGWRFSTSGGGSDEGWLTERRLGVEEAVPRLVAAGRIDAAVRRVAEARRQDPARERALVRLLVDALGRHGAESSAAPVRAAAAAVLAASDGNDPLLLGLARDREASVRQAAYAALARRGACTSCRNALLKAAGDGAAEADRAAAVEALGRLGHTAAIPVLREGLANRGPARASAEALARLGDWAEARALIGRLLAGAPEARRRGAAAAAGLADPQLLLPITSALKGADEPLRLALVGAFAAVAHRDPAAARRPLLRLLGDPSATVRAAVAEAIAETGSAAAVRVRLIDCLADPDPGVRGAAAAALVRVGGAEAHDDLVRAARDHSALVRSRLAVALVRHPFDGSGPLLATLRRDTDPSVVAALAAPPAAVEVALAPAAAVAELLRAEESLGALQAAAVWLQAK